MSTNTQWNSNKSLIIFITEDMLGKKKTLKIKNHKL